jgi:hypothetical protein
MKTTGVSTQSSLDDTTTGRTPVPIASGMFNQPQQIAVDGNSNLYVVDSTSNSPVTSFAMEFTKSSSWATYNIVESNDIESLAAFTSQGYTVQLTNPTGNQELIVDHDWNANFDAFCGGATSVGSTPTVASWPAASAIVYGEKLSSSKLTGGKASVAGTFAWTKPTMVPAKGANSYSVTFTPKTSTDYNTVEGNVKVTAN